MNITSTDESPSQWSRSSSDPEDPGGGFQRVRISCSQQRYAPVQLQGVLTREIVDSGANVTIVGGELFR